MENFEKRFILDANSKEPVIENTTEAQEMDRHVQFALGTRDRLKARKNRGNARNLAVVEANDVSKKETNDELANLVEEDQTNAKKRIEAIYIAVAEVLNEQDGRNLAEIKEAELARYTRLVARGIKTYKSEDEKKIADLVSDKLQQRALEGDRVLAEAAIRRKEKGIDKELTAEEKEALVNIDYGIRKFREVEKQDIEKTGVEDRGLVEERLVEAKMFGTVEQNLDKFNQVQPIVAEKLVAEGKGKVVVDNLEKFSNMNSEVALALLKENYSLVIVANLRKFANLSEEVAGRLLASNKVSEVAENMTSFQAEAHKDISGEIIRKGGVREVIENKAKFSNIDREVNVPEFPKKTTFQDLYELYEAPELGGMQLVDSLQGMNELSFKDQIKDIIESQKEKACYFFEVVKSKYRGKIGAEEIAEIMKIARENPRNGAEALLAKNAVLVG